MKLIRLPKKVLRLKRYRHRKNGFYFVTLCTRKKENLFGKLYAEQGYTLSECKLTVLGKMVQKELKSLDNRFNNIEIIKYVIMPNHIHAVIGVERPETTVRPDLKDFVSAFKKATTKAAKKHDKLTGRKLWRRGFRSHIIRNQAEHKAVLHYIDSNPLRWHIDRYFVE